MNFRIQLIRYGIVLIITLIHVCLFAQEKNSNILKGNNHVGDTHTFTKQTFISPTGESISVEEVICGLSDGQGNFLAQWNFGLNVINTYCPDQDFSVGINTKQPLQALDVRGNQYLTGKLGIGTSNPQFYIDVVSQSKNYDLLRLKNAYGTQVLINRHGKVFAKEVEVTLSGPLGDFVFEDDYELRSLHELEQFVKSNKHLPGIPSEQTVKENGLNLGEMDALLLQKIEELSLYVIELNKKIKAQEKVIQDMKNSSENE